jgi:hypothetical protein
MGDMIKKKEECLEEYNEEKNSNEHKHETLLPNINVLDVGRYGTAMDEKITKAKIFLELYELTPRQLC